MIVHIDRDPVHSFRLTGDEVAKFREKALEDTKDLFLKYYDKVYQQLMDNDFNPLWTPDSKSDNDLDFKDDFWRVSYFLFNICLLTILKKEYDLEVVDRTRSDFETQKYLYKFLKKEGIVLKKLHKKKRLINKSAIRRFIIGSIKNLPANVQSFKEELKNKFMLKLKAIPKTSASKKRIYLFVEPVGEMRFAEWRYADLIKKYKRKEYEIFLISTVDFKDSESQDIRFININRLLTKRELIKVLAKSVLIKLKVLRYKWREQLRIGVRADFQYFLKNLPSDFFYPYRENVGFDKLFKALGRGLLIIKGPVMNKSGAMQISHARKYGIRTLILSSRIYTPTRLSNQFVQSHFNERFPIVFPHSMVVNDRISFDTIQKQTNAIELYCLGSHIISLEKKQTAHTKPFRITLVLQKKKEIEVMTDEVISVVQKMDGVVLNLKMHPLFPIYDHLKEKYQKVPFVNIFPMETSLDDAIFETDVCITSYSSAAFEFSKKGKPVIWLSHVTLNSLFFAKFHKKVGIIVESSDELREVIIKMKEDVRYYQKERANQHSQIKGLIYNSVDTPDSLSGIINKELAKA